MSIGISSPDSSGNPFLAIKFLNFRWRLCQKRLKRIAGIAPKKEKKVDVKCIDFFIIY